MSLFSMTLILASGSKYRLNLLQKAGFSPKVISPQLDENKIKSQLVHQSPLQIAQTLAALKAKNVQERICQKTSSSNYTLLASDQIGLYNKKILNKPQNFETNVSQLLEIQGQDHQLITCVYISIYKTPKEKSSQKTPLPPQVISFHDITTLTMKPFTLEEIQEHVKKDPAYDCTGGYRYESQGHTLFSQVKSKDPTAIEGLPMKALTKVLREWL